MNGHALEIDWHLTNRCNFFCEYCHPQIRRVLNIKDLNEKPPEEYEHAFTRLAECCHILMSGGEPFMFPGFIDLCTRLTKKHFISLNTNLSHEDVKLFFDSISPDRVKGIFAAIHIEERERLGLALEKYAENYVYGKARNFSLRAAYVLYPPILNRAQKDIAYLKELGVDQVAGKVFKGVYDKKRYPDSYSESERQIVRSLSGVYTMTEPYLAGETSYKGQLCNAGVVGIKVDVKGNIQRCATVQQKLGNLFDETLVLPSAPYGCPAHRVLVVSECKSRLVVSQLDESSH